MSKFLIFKSFLCGSALFATSLGLASGSEASEIQPVVAAETPAQQQNAVSIDTVKRAPVPGMSRMVPVSQLEGTPAPASPASPTAKSRSNGQVTSVSQLSDVQPTDWAFQALQSLVERYGCIAGYPNGTYRGNRALSRYEFAAGLNACMDRISELITAATEPMARKEDLEVLKKLQEEYSAELASIRGVVDSLEARTAVLESQQFSTTTKLQGETIFALAGMIGDETAINSDVQRRVSAGATPDPRTDVEENTIFANRARLNFDASFTGKDRLRVRLQATNVTPFSGSFTGTNQTRLGFDGSNNNDVVVQKLEYRFPVGERLTVYAAANAGEFNDNMYTFNPLFESSARGSISRFGRFNPIYRIGAGGDGAGVTFTYKLFEKLTLSGGYLAASSAAANPDEGQGLFNGTYSALAQVRYQPLKDMNIGFTYVRSYSRVGDGISGSTGTGFANNPFGGSTTLRVPTSVNAVGLQADYKIAPKFVVAGWVGYTEAYAKRSVGVIGSQGTAADPAVNDGDKSTSLNWAVTFGFPDVLKQGALAGIVIGQPPKTLDSDFGRSADIVSNGVDIKNRREDDDTTYHFEGFYRYNLNDNIDITPGLLVILNPEGNSDNDTIFVGTLRTTFRF
jgi:Carbohydrate-selective porin, OprB family/S-layer homology domain